MTQSYYVKSLPAYYHARYHQFSPSDQHRKHHEMWGLWKYNWENEGLNIPPSPSPKPSKTDQIKFKQYVNCLLWQWVNSSQSLISGFHRDVDEICGLLGNYTASCGNYLPTFRHNVSVPSSRVKFPRGKESWPREDGTDTLSRNVGK
jgi:hypothetical protein